MPRLVVLRHVPFEYLGNVGAWARARNWDVSEVRFFEDGHPGDLTRADLVVILGGPMGVNDDAEHPWLAEEKQAIRDALNQDVPMVGFCLGAQLLSDALGGTVTTDVAREVGWFPVEQVPERPWCAELPQRFESFHWHFDTFSIPPGGEHLFRSAGCENQGFKRGNVIGVQFHPEMDSEGPPALYHRLGADLPEGKYIQKKRMSPSDPRTFSHSETLCFHMLDTVT